MSSLFFVRPLGRETYLKILKSLLKKWMFQEEEENIHFRFRIVNRIQSGRRASGFVFVVLKTGNSYIVWPHQDGMNTEVGYSFNDGDSFCHIPFSSGQCCFYHHQ